MIHEAVRFEPIEESVLRAELERRAMVIAAGVAALLGLRLGGLAASFVPFTFDAMPFAPHELGLSPGIALMALLGGPLLLRGIVARPRARAVVLGFGAGTTIASAGLLLDALLGPTTPMFLRSALGDDGAVGRLLDFFMLAIALTLLSACVAGPIGALVANIVDGVARSLRDAVRAPTREAQLRVELHLGASVLSVATIGAVSELFLGELGGRIAPWLGVALWSSAIGFGLVFMLRALLARRRLEARVTALMANRDPELELLDVPPAESLAALCDAGRGDRRTVTRRPDGPYRETTRVVGPLTRVV